MIKRTRTNTNARWGQLIETHGSQCVYCHIQPATVVDHIIPWSVCHSHDITNLVPSCEWCNLIAGCSLFSDFDEKYEYIREERASRRHGKFRKTTCSTCRVPYQYPLHKSNMFMCPECYDEEYNTCVSLKKQWQEWKQLLDESGMPIKIFRTFKVSIGTSASPSVKRDVLANIQMDYAMRE